MVKTRAVWTRLLLLCCLFIAGYSVKPRKIHIEYPVELLAPVMGNSFTSVAAKDSLKCFGNRAYRSPTYRDGLACIAQLLISFDYNCVSIFGSRTVEVESVGNLEVFKMSRLPGESKFHEPVSLTATRWLELAHDEAQTRQSEAVMSAAEPLYLCIRSSEWRRFPSTWRERKRLRAETQIQAHTQQQVLQSNADSTLRSNLQPIRRPTAELNGTKFSVAFKSSQLRENDRHNCRQKLLWHFLFVVIGSSTYFLPYVAALAAATFSYSHGMKVFMTVFGCSAMVVCLCPFMLTKKNRNLAKHYISYFFRKHGKDGSTREIIKQSRPLFQSIFFSCVVVCAGSLLALFCHTYLGIHREWRNEAVRITLFLATGWVTFFLVRSFERFCRDWSWLVFSAVCSQFLDRHVNPMGRDEVIVAVIVFSLLFRMVVTRIAAISMVQRLATDLEAGIENYLNFVKFGTQYNEEVTSLLLNSDEAVSSPLLTESEGLQETPELDSRALTWTAEPATEIEGEDESSSSKAGKRRRRRRKKIAQVS